MMRRRARPARRSALASTSRTYKIKTTIDFGTISSDGSGNYVTCFAGNITELDNSAGNNYGAIGQQTALRSLYDEYRIDAIKFTFVPLFTQATGGGGGVSAGQVTYAINKSPDADLPTGFVDILRQNDCKVQNTTKGMAITVRRPQWSAVTPISAQVDTGGAQLRSAVSAASHAWCSTRESFGVDNTKQPYWYGLDFAMENAGASQQIYRLFKTYYVSFRSQT